MSEDSHEQDRRDMTAEVNAIAGSKQVLEKLHGQVWDTAEMQTDFEVLTFRAPFIVVRRRADLALGSLVFQHRPRFYFGFTED